MNNKTLKKANTHKSESKYKASHTRTPVSDNKFYTNLSYDNKIDIEDNSSLQMICDILTNDYTYEHIRFKSINLSISNWLMNSEKSNINISSPLILSLATIKYLNELVDRQIHVQFDTIKKPCLPPRSQSKNEDIFINLCFETFKLPRTSYNFNHELYNSDKLINIRAFGKHVSRRIQYIQSGMCDETNDDKKSQTSSDPFINNESTFSNEELSDSNVQLSRNILEYLNNEDTNILQPSKDLSYAQQTVLINCDEFFINGMVEPVFGTLAIHNIVRQSKISENFYFSKNKNFDDTSNDKINKLNIFNKTHCYFSFRETDIDALWIFIRMEKILEKNNVQKVSNFYGKIPDSKLLEAQSKNARNFLSKCSPYRTTVGFAVIPLAYLVKESEVSQKDRKWKAFSVIKSDIINLPMNKSSQNQIAERQLTFCQFYSSEICQTDDDIYKFISDIQNAPPSTKKSPYINACFSAIIKTYQNVHLLHTNKITSLFSDKSSQSSTTNTHFVHLKTISDSCKYPNTVFSNDLYIYPNSINLSKSPSKIKSIQLVFYLLENEPNNLTDIENFISQATPHSTSILYSNQTPTFYDEIKIEIPFTLKSTAHLLCIIKNISISKNYDCISSTVGYTWWPMKYEAEYLSGTADLPISTDLIPGYSSNKPFDSPYNFKWLESRKPLLRLQLKFKSSIFSTCKQTMAFFHSLNSKPTKEKSIWKNVSAQLLKLGSVRISGVIKNFPVFLNIFLALINDSVNINDYINYNHDGVKVSEQVFTAFIDVMYIFHDNTKYMRSPLDDHNGWLSDYIENYVFNRKITLNHIETNKIFNSSDAENLISNESSDFNNMAKKLILMTLYVSGIPKYDAKINACLPMLLSLILKAVGSDKSSIKESQDSTRIEFDQQLSNLIERLLYIIIKRLKAFNDIRLTSTIRIVNDSVSEFLFALFFMINRGTALFLIKTYTSLLLKWKYGDAYLLAASFLTPFILSHEVNAFDFIVVVSKEAEANFETFNNNFKGYLKYDQLYIAEHSIIALWLELIKHNTPRILQSEFCKIFLVTTVKLLVHTDNLKISSTVTDKVHEQSELSKILAILLFPILDIISKSIVELTNSSHSHIESSSFISGLCDSISDHRTSVMSDVSGEVSFMKENSHQILYKTLFLIFFWIIRSVDHQFLTFMWSNYSTCERTTFLDLFYPCISLFPFSDMSLNDNSLPNLDLKNVILKGTVKTLSSQRTVKYSKTRQFVQMKRTSRRMYSPHLDIQLSNSFAHFYGKTAIYFISHIIQRIDSSTSNRPIIYKILDFITKILDQKRQLEFLQSLLSIIINNVNKFCDLIFLLSPKFIYSLVSPMVSLLKSPVLELRKLVIKVLLSLCAQEFKQNKNISLMRASFTTAAYYNTISESVQTKIGAFNDSLSILETTANLEDTTLSNKIVSFVRDIVSGLELYRSISASGENVYEVIDKLERIASKFKNIPQIRLKWLKQMRKILYKNKFHYQAALCCLHSAIIVKQYIDYQKNVDCKPKSFEIFANITSNYSIEFFNFELVSKSYDLTDEFLNNEYYQKMLMKSVSYLTMCNGHHIIFAMNNIVSEAYCTSQMSYIAEYNKIYTESLSYVGKNKDLINVFTFFRVAFYSLSYYIVENGEYIYCEPPHTKISEFTENIDSCYKNLLIEFNQKVEIIRDSAPVDTSKLLPDILYVQITIVYPYNNNTYLVPDCASHSHPPDHRYFYYDTPFTIGGQARGDLFDQYQRLTIIESEFYIPSINPRGRVISSREIILKPIDVIQLDISKRAQELDNIISQNVTDIKLLQLKLGGCIGASVNQGPAEAAKIFLEPFLSNEINLKGEQALYNLEYTRSVNKLYVTFKILTQICQKAIESMQKDSSSSDVAYVEHMTVLYNQLQQRIGPLLLATKTKINKIMQTES